MCFVGVLFYRECLAMIDARLWVLREQECMSALARSLSLIKDAETGQRGYLLTTDRSYLTPYEESKRKIPASLARIQQLTSDDPDQQNSVKEIRSLVERKLQELESTIGLCQKEGIEQAVHVVRTDKGRQLMDVIRSKFETMESRERSRLLTRIATLDARTQTVWLVFSGLVALALALFGCFGIFLQRYLRDLDSFQTSITRQEGLLSSILDSISEGLIVADESGKFLLVNRAAEGITGIGTVQIAPDKWSEFYGCFLPDGVTPYPSKELPLYRAVRGEHVDGQEVVLRNEHLANPICLNVSANPLNPAAGFPNAGVVVFSDISERKRVEDQLLESERKFRLVIENAYDAIVQIDLDGRIADLNPQAEKMFGWTKHELIGKNFSDTIFENNAAKHFGELGFIGFNSNRDESILNRRLELIAQRRDGLELPIEMAVVPIKAGSVTAFCAFMQDISLRKEGEQRMNEFYALLSHELRTPMTAILGSLELMATGAAGDLPELAQELVGISQIETDRLLRLINSILDLKKIESGKSKLALTAIDPKELIDSTIRALQPLAKPHGIILRGEVNSTKSLLCDRDRITQVLNNFISNAIKYSPEGGSISIIVDDKTDRLRFSVVDRGPGIPSDQLIKLFHKFQQLKAPASGATGTGLGLAISKSIVEQHGGRVGVDSEVGVGSTFWFEIPITS